MKKNLILYLFLSLTTLPVFGQTAFQKNLDFALDTAYVRALPDGKSFFVVGKVTKNGRMDIHFLKISNDGDILWHKVHVSSPPYDLKGVALQSDGILALMSSSSSAFLLKLDSQNGARTFAKLIAEDKKIEMFELATDDRDNIWLTGLHHRQSNTDSTYYFQMKTDKNGVPARIQSSVFRLNVLNQASNVIQYYKLTNMTWHNAGQKMVGISDFSVAFTKSLYLEGSISRYFSMVIDSNLTVGQTYKNYNITQLQSNTKYFLFGAAVVDYPALGVFGLNKPYTFGLIRSDWTAEERIRETDDGVMQPVHSFGNDIVFYSTKHKTLTKYNEQMKPIWVKKYDFCSNTTAFSADIALDGSIFTARKIGEETIISRMNPDGELPTCVSKNEMDVVEYPYRATPQPNSIAYHGEPRLPIFKDDNLKINDKMSVLTAFCVKNSAAFSIPDTACLDTSLKPIGVDSSRGLKHEWIFKPNTSDTSVPTINLNKVGIQPIFHRIQFGQCEDSLTKLVTVVAPPITKLNDTVICGQKRFSIDLTDKNTTSYAINNRPINPIYSFDSSGIYAIKLRSKACLTEKKVSIKINDFAIPKITQVGLPCTNEPYPIVFEKIFKNVLWDNKLVSSDTIFITNGLPHTYSLTYKLDSNCIIRGTAQINRRVCTDIFVPTIFSPNDDFENDVFQAYPQANFKVTSLAVYDKWGELLFNSTDGTNAWDGKFKGQDCTIGTYIYVVKYLNIKTLKTEIISGDINLIR